MFEFYVKFLMFFDYCFLGLDKDKCLFCLQSEDNEEKFGRKIKKFGLTIHYFCMVRS